MTLESLGIQEQIVNTDAITPVVATRMMIDSALDQLIYESKGNDAQELEYYFWNDRFMGIKPNAHQIKRALKNLDADASLSETERLILGFNQAIDAAGPRTRGGNEHTEIKRHRSSEFAYNFFGTHFTVVNVDKFLASSLEPFVASKDVLEKLGEQKADAETISRVLSHYKNIDLSKVHLFGENGALSVLEPEEQQGYLDRITADLLVKMDQDIERMQKRTQNPIYGDYRFSGLYDLDLLQNALKQLEAAASHRIVVSDPKAVIKKLASAANNICSYYDSRVSSGYRKSVEELSVLYEQLENKLPDGLKGQGLEFIASQSGSARRVYLDGELVGAFDNATFSNQPTNGEIVAWVESHVLDYDRLSGGAQRKQTVQVWRKGWDKSMEIYERHAWPREGYFFINAPIVEEDGKVVYKVDGGSEVPATIEFRLK